MLLVGSVNWTVVLTALIAGLPAIISAVFAVKIHSQVQTPSGDPIGKVMERAHETGIANNLLLRVLNGETVPAESGQLQEAAQAPPEVPADKPPPQV